MFAEFEPSPMTQWETIPREFGGWGNVVICLVALFLFVSLVTFLSVRLVRRLARHVS